MIRAKKPVHLLDNWVVTQHIFLFTIESGFEIPLKRAEKQVVAYLPVFNLIDFNQDSVHLILSKS